jgi:DNA-binding SARP family transcriptional activator/WD40 repeat protein
MRIGVLGPIDVEVDGQPVPVGGSQQRRLLGLLVVHRDRAVSTERIVEALWDGDAPDGAARSVRTYVSRLRAALPGVAIERSDAGYVLELDEASVDLDADAFGRLLDRASRQPPDLALAAYDEALALWRGPPFGDLADEWWALPDALRLTEQRHAAEEDRAAAMIAVGAHDRAIADLERIVAALPHRERPVRLLVQALALADRRAEAARVAQAFRARLADDTGLDPSPEIDRLVSAVLDGDDAYAIDLPLRGYTLRRLIGRGRHGHVYTATQPATRREVAIRVIERDLADDPDFVRRFDADARLVAKLDHPNIAALVDYWREPGSAVLVSGLVTGGSIRDDVVTSGPWSLDRVGGLLDGLRSALGTIPSRALSVDLGAGNVLLDEHGEPHLTDFRIGAGGPDALDPAVALARLAREAITGAEPGMPATVGASIPEAVTYVLDRAERGDFADVDEFHDAWCSATGRRSRSERPTNPYRGLRAFDEVDAASFFGRSDFVDDLQRRSETTRFLTVIGPSGAGKSSVVRAGLTPRLRDDGAVVITLTPGDDALRSLRDAVGTVASIDDATADVLDEVVAVARTMGRLVIVVDQFEECWTRCADDVRLRFLDLLGSAIARDDADVRVVTTLRSDLLARPLEDYKVGGLIGSGALVLGAMSAGQLRQAIEQPALGAGVSFADGVADELVAAAVGQPGFLPLLQFTLTELFDRRDGDRITTETLASVGGIAGAIGRRADDAFSQLDAHGQLAARELFGRLVLPGDGQPDTRRRARRSELSPQVEAVAEHFVAGRLLVIDREPDSREPTFEVAHETLFDSWPRLRRWIDEDRTWLLQRDHLERVATQWDEAGQPDSELYRGARLEAAIEALESGGRAMSKLSTEFVGASRRLRDADLDAERRRVRRLRAVVAATSVLALIAATLGAFALRQRNDAREAEAAAEAASRRAETEADSARDARSAAEAAGRDEAIEALVGRSEALRRTQRDVAALLAVEAFRLQDGPRTRSALFATFTDDERYLDTRRLGGDGGRSGIIVAGLGAFITDAAGRLHEYDLDTGELGVPLPALGMQHPDAIPVLVASDDASQLLHAGRHDLRTGPTTVGVIDLDRRELQFTPVTVDQAVTSAAFLPDGRIALATGEDGRVVVIDGATGAVAGEITGLDVPPDEITWTAAPVQTLRRGSGVAVDGDTLIVGASNGAVRLVDLPDLRVRTTLRLPPETTSNLVPIDDTLIASGRGGVTRIGIDDGAPLWAIAEADRCSRLLVLPERGSAFCGGSFGRIEELDLETGNLRRRLDAQTGIRASLWVTDDGSELVRFDDSEPVVSRWRIDGSGPITAVTPAGFVPVDFDASGRRLLLDRGDPRSGTYLAGIVDVDDPRMLSPTPGVVLPGWVGEDELFGGAPVSPGRFEFAHADVTDIVDGATVDITTSGVAVADAQLISGVSLETGKQRSLMRYLDPDDDRRASITTTDPVALRVGPRIEVTDMITWSVNTTGDRVVAGTNDGIQIYDSDTGALLDEFGDSRRRTAVVTVADQLLVGSLDGTITWHDLESLELIQTINGGRGLRMAPSSTSDGRSIAVLTGDSSVSIYDTATGIRYGDALRIPLDATNAFFAPRLSPDGSALAIRSGYDASIETTELWSLDPERWIEAACALAGRNLTPDEWTTHIGELEPYRTTCPEFGDGS